MTPRRSAFARHACRAVLVLSVALAGCGSDDDPIVLPDGATITTSGGRANGDTGTGGDAGGIEMALDHGGGGTIEVRSTGVVDAGFVPTPGGVIDPGATPLVVASDLVVPVVVAEPTTGTVYAMPGDASLYVSDGNGTAGDETPVSGLEIRTGATLTLPITNAAAGSAELDFSHDLVNDGVMTVVDAGASARGSIDLFTLGSYHGSGRIETHATSPGQDGGAIGLYVHGAIHNAGAFTSYGADRTNGDGGDGGEIFLRTDDVTRGEAIENTGTMDSHGGSATGGSGVGGRGGPISLVAYLSLWSSGDLDAGGGDGLQGGGDGGDVTLAALYRGELRNAGDVSSDGGTTSNGTAGNGGLVGLGARGGAIASSGGVWARGGHSTGPGGVAGAGGAITFYTSASDDTWEPAPLDVAAGDISVSGPIDGSGGAATGTGGTAGNGGLVGFEVDDAVSLAGQSIHLLGYGTLRARGGNGFTAGSGVGVGADVAATSGTPTGPIVLEAAVDIAGGGANPQLAGSTGGDGGDLTLRGGSRQYGRVTLSGGSGATPGANGAVIVLP